MKVSILIPHYLHRTNLLQRSLYLLDNQTYPDYEIIIVDDGSDDIIESNKKIRYFRLRESSSPPREDLPAYRKAYQLCSGDFIITSCSEIMPPKNAIEVLLDGEIDRRQSPTMYYLSREQTNMLEEVDWKENLSVIKGLPSFWETQSPWLYDNISASGHHNHICFGGQSREAWDKYGFLIGNESKLHELEMKDNIPAIPVELEVYHQYHKRVFGMNPDQDKYSARIKRIKGL